MSARYRWILAHDEPPLLGYDQDLWVDRLHRPTESTEALFSFFEPLRAANIACGAGFRTIGSGGSVCTPSEVRRATT